MSSFKLFDIAGSGMAAQSVRLNSTASNLANADSISGDPNKVYRARHPVFEAVRKASTGTASVGQQNPAVAVRVRGVVESTAAPEARFEPGNPLANPEGYVFAPSVNVVEEMVDMISASRSYQNNVEVMNTSKELLLATLKLGQ